MLFLTQIPGRAVPLTIAWAVEVDYPISTTGTGNSRAVRSKRFGRDCISPPTY